jgi:predicted permease
MRDVDPGFRADHVLVAGYNLPSQQYPNPTASDAFNRSLLERLQAMPGVVTAGITNVLPASGFQGGSAYVPDETARDDASGGQLKIAPWSASEGKYFQAMGIRLVQGRVFNADDKPGAPLVALVNQKLANRFWPKGDAIGRRVRIGTPESKTPWVTIVGVVENTKMNALDAPDTEQVYAPSQQLSGMFGQFAPKDQGGFNGFIALRSTLPPEQMTNALRSAVATLDPQLALQQMQTMDEALSSSEAPRRFNTSLVSVFALGALLLAAIGVYAVIAFSVSMRSQEMAIRMALGSRRGEIVRLVLVAGAKLAAIGCVAGLVGALAVSKLLGSMLFNVSATDPLILTGSIAIMIVLSLVACAIPAQRAASANPVDALRSE